MSMGVVFMLLFYVPVVRMDKALGKSVERAVLGAETYSPLTQ